MAFPGFCNLLIEQLGFAFLFEYDLLTWGLNKWTIVTGALMDHDRWLESQTTVLSAAAHTAVRVSQMGTNVWQLLSDTGDRPTLQRARYTRLSFLTLLLKSVPCLNILCSSTYDLRADSQGDYFWRLMLVLLLVQSSRHRRGSWPPWCLVHGAGPH